MSTNLILLIIAVICFFFAAVGFPKTEPISIGWLGMFFLGLSMLIK